MRELIGFIVSECIKMGVTVHLVPVEYLEDGTSGTWADEDKTLSVATKSKNWIEVLAHEFGHFQQWKARKFCDEVYEEVYGSGIYDEWLAGKVKLSPERIEEMTLAMQACEIDAEKRAYRLLKKFEVEVDLERYVQKANAYVLFYNVMASHRQWCDGKSPSRIDEVADMMPTKFISDFKDMPEGFERLILEKCFKPKSRLTRFRHWLR